MVQSPVPHCTSTTEYVPDDVLQVGIKIFANTSKAGKHLRAFGNYIGPFTAVDMTTGYKLGTLRSYLCASS